MVVKRQSSKNDYFFCKAKGIKTFFCLYGVRSVMVSIKVCGTFGNSSNLFGRPLDIFKNIPIIIIAVKKIHFARLVHCILKTVCD